MSSLKEKLSILSEMIGFAKVNNVIKNSEYDFLLNVSQELDVDIQNFKELFNTKVDHIVPKTEAERIVQFHRLILLMNVDNQQEPFEVKKLYNVVLSMGLPPGAIQQVLLVMHQYPNRIVPPDVLIGIFKTYLN